ncbi:hypothetical protein L2E82_50764 [Cichorium intybus]|nr:hypothetical protein L2E82_50764 [Cichorium intybus]
MAMADGRRCGSDNGSLASSDDDDVGFDSSSEDGRVDADGISDTRAQNNEPPEEGEFIADNKASVDNSFSRDNVVDQLGDPHIPDQVPVDDCVLDDNMVDGPDNPADVPPAPRSTNAGPSWPINPSWVGPMADCNFGPTHPDNDRPDFTPSKKRKLNSRNLRFNPYRRPSSSSPQPSGSINFTPSIDLNKDIPQTSLSNPDKHAAPDDNDISTSISSTSKEITQTINIGSC